MMKNKWLMVFIMVFLLSMTACGNGNQAEDGKKNATVEQKDSVALEKESGKTVPKDGKVLVAYFAVAENSDVDAILIIWMITV